MNAVKSFSISEYLKLEIDALDRHEYRNGEIFKMANNTFAHSIISTNISTIFGNASSNHSKDYYTLGCQIKIFIEQVNYFVYPDVVLIWDKVNLHSLTDHAITNPNLIIEILSEETEAYDRGNKFHFYSTLPSLKEYILVDQEQAIVDVFVKEKTNLWKMTTIQGLDKSFPIHTLGFEIKMADLYKKVPNLKNPQFNLDL